MAGQVRLHQSQEHCSLLFLFIYAENVENEVCVSSQFMVG